MENWIAITEIIKNLAIAVATLLAIWGGRAGWTHYIKKRKEELIVEVLETFYLARDAFKRIRSPMSYAGEGETRPQSDDETKEEKEIFNRTYVPIERFKREEQIFRKLEGLKYKFIANFGKEKAKPFEELVNAVNQIIVASDMLKTSWLQQGRHFSTERAFQSHLERMHKYEGIIWEGAQDSDELKQKIDNAIGEMEKICEKLLKDI